MYYSRTIVTNKKETESSFPTSVSQGREYLNYYYYYFLGGEGKLLNTKMYIKLIIKQQIRDLKYNPC